MGTYAKRYGVDRYTAYDELTAIGFWLPATAARWTRRPLPVPRRARRLTDEPADPDWIRVDDRWMFVVGHTSGGAPFGCYSDEFENPPWAEAWLHAGLLSPVSLASRTRE